MIRTSVAATVLSEGWRRAQTALSSSTLGAWIQKGTEGTATAAGHSRVAETVRWSGRAVRSSWLYRWLTAEPETDVVVIDLRETATVGPLLAVLDRLVGWVASYWRSAGTRTAVDDLSGAVAVRPVQVASTVVLAAVVSALLLRAALGSLSSNALGFGLLAASLALAGTRVTASADELTETYVYELLAALLSPPEPPE